MVWRNPPWIWAAPSGSSPGEKMGTIEGRLFTSFSLVFILRLNYFILLLLLLLLIVMMMVVVMIMLVLLLIPLLISEPTFLDIDHWLSKNEPPGTMQVLVEDWDYWGTQSYGASNYQVLSLFSVRQPLCQYKGWGTQPQGLSTLCFSTCQLLFICKILFQNRMI